MSTNGYRKSVLEELKKLNPKDDTGRRPHRRHQFLTDNIGNPHLEKHVTCAITLMKISAGFKKHLDKALPMPKAQLFVTLNDDEEDGGRQLSRPRKGRSPGRCESTGASRTLLVFAQFQ